MNLASSTFSEGRVAPSERRQNGTSTPLLEQKDHSGDQVKDYSSIRCTHRVRYSSMSTLIKSDLGA